MQVHTDKGMKAKTQHHYQRPHQQVEKLKDFQHIKT